MNAKRKYTFEELIKAGGKNAGFYERKRPMSPSSNGKLIRGKVYRIIYLPSRRSHVTIDEDGELWTIGTDMGKFEEAWGPASSKIQAKENLCSEIPFHLRRVLKVFNLNSPKRGKKLCKSKRQHW